MREWSFLSNHGAVLAMVGQHGRITAKEIAAATGITERSVHRIIADLESGQYLKKSRDGRINRYQVDSGRPLPHPLRHEVAVGDLLRVLLPAGRG